MFDGANNYAPHAFNASLAGMLDVPDGSWYVANRAHRRAD
jgi:hypothetical protein